MKSFLTRKIALFQTPPVQTSASEIETDKGTERTVTIKGIERTVEIP